MCEVQGVTCLVVVVVVVGCVHGWYHVCCTTLHVVQLCKPVSRRADGFQLAAYGYPTRQ